MKMIVSCRSGVAVFAFAAALFSSSETMLGTESMDRLYPSVSLAGISPDSGVGRQNWKDGAGKSFKGEVAGVFGPMAVFKTGRAAGRRVLFESMSAEDCVRFYHGCSVLPGRGDWAESKSEMSRGLKDNLRCVKEGELLNYAIEGKMEPELYVLFFASHGVGRSWDMMGAGTERYWDLKEKHGDKFEAFYIGLNHVKHEHDRMATSMHLPWPFVEHGVLNRVYGFETFVPRQAPVLLVVNRHGVPFISEIPKNKEDVFKIMEQLDVLLEALNPESPQTWRSKKHFLAAVQAATVGEAKADPIMIGSPLRADKLVEFGVTSFEATLFVDANGAVSNVSMFAGPGLPQDLVEPLAEALRQAPFVPAIDNGKFVEGRYVYRFAP